MKFENCCSNTPFTKDPRSKRILCKHHFSQVFEKRVKKTINKYSMLKRDDHLGFGYSGGKDSTVLLHILTKLLRNYPKSKMTVITIDEGIRGYRDGCMELTKEITQRYNVNQLIVSFQDLYGASLDQIISKSVNSGKSLSPCAICGILRRRALNYGASKARVTKIVTAHNLDDEAQSIIMNMLRGDSRKFMRYTRKPVQNFPSLKPRIRPLVNISEPEIVLYAYANNLIYHSIPCPYAYSAMRNDIRDFLMEMEKKRSGTLTNVVNLHDSLSQYFPQKKNLIPTHLCEECNEVTTHKICPVCQLLSDLGLEISNP
ncbi:MAG: TIGR00269 family protein [Candidatus Hodarchaeales archaeon]